MCSKPLTLFSTAKCDEHKVVCSSTRLNPSRAAHDAVKYIQVVFRHTLIRSFRVTVLLIDLSTVPCCSTQEEPGVAFHWLTRARISENI